MKSYNDEDEAAAIQERLKEIGHIFKQAFPANWGFVFLVFPFGQKGTLFYTSNAQRGDVIATMEEFIEATKGEWLQHKPEDDTELARLRQRVTQLERELAIAKGSS